MLNVWVLVELLAFTLNPYMVCDREPVLVRLAAADDGLSTLAHLVLLQRHMLGVTIVSPRRSLQKRPGRGEVRAVVEEFHVGGGVVAKLGSGEKAAVDLLRLKLKLNRHRRGIVQASGGNGGGMEAGQR